MPAVFVIHAARNKAFVTEHLLPPLPALGFERWLSADLLAADIDTAPVIEDAMRSCAAILAVLSDESAAEATVREQIELALRSGRPVVPVRHVTTWREKWGDALASLPTAETNASSTPDTVDDEVLRKSLSALLPPPRDEESRDTLSAKHGMPIPWDETIFSEFLKDAVDRHDYNRGDTLVTALTRHLRMHRAPYSVAHARRDLGELRNQRQFALMRRYAEAALESGIADFRVRRQYAQALIELGDFSDAVPVLEKIAQAGPTNTEWSEAEGLLGRVYKQQYVNAPDTPDAGAYLRRALERYGGVFRADGEKVWHGINTVSLLRRAVRDGVDPGSVDDAQNMARQILVTLDKREAELRRNEEAQERTDEGEPAHLEVWDIATRVEAHLALGEYEAASAALDEYLAHPEMHAFEVSSTYRQFDEVLQLDQDPRARELMDRLWSAVERHRTGGAQAPPPDTKSAEAAAATSRLLLVRVSDPGWRPSEIPDLEIKTRLGTVLSVAGTAHTVKALLKDPLVVSVEESRPSGLSDCVRSVPFINVADSYTGLTGESFSEKGARALVAIIDEGIDVLHKAFLDTEGRSRIVGIWDQRDSNGPAPDGYDFGTYHTREQIAGYIEKNRDVPAEKVVLPQGLMKRNADGHGTHVASVAAGRKVGEFGGGVAPDALLLIIISSGGESTGYSHAHLAALTFIDKMATELQMPVVVNVSQGMNAGAHDGKSLVEIGFDGFSEGGRKPGRVIVKSAGNEGDTHGHAELKPAAGAAMTLPWTCEEGMWLRDRIELWWNSANQYRFRLAEPNGQSTDWVDLANPKAKGKLRGVPYDLQLVRRHVDNGDSRLTLELGSGFTPIPPGTWSLNVHSIKVVEAGAIQAWIERRDTSRSKFLKHADQEMTVTIPGTASSVITVAAVNTPVASDPIEAGEFSSYGPTRDGRNKPDVCAPGVKIAAARGGSIDATLAMDGTSMAAPHVAGAIALLLSRAVQTAETREEWPTASQIGTALRQNTQNYNGIWSPSQGYGVVDVAALLNAL